MRDSETQPHFFCRCRQRGLSRREQTLRYLLKHPEYDEPLAARAEHQRDRSRRARLHLQPTAHRDLGQLTGPASDRHDLELPANEFGDMLCQQLANEDGLISSRSIWPWLGCSICGRESCRRSLEAEVTTSCG
jgi:hypothetical protein